MFKTYDEPPSPSEGAWLRCMMNHHRQMRGHVDQFTMYDEPISPNEGGGVFKI